MINCKRAAELSCAKLDRPLTIGETMQLRFHIFMCRACKGFQLQNEALLRLFEQRFQEPRDGADSHLPELPEDACERLKQLLRDASSESGSPE